MFPSKSSVLALLVAIVATTEVVNAQQVIVNETLACEGAICVDKRTITTPIEEGVGGWTWTYDFVHDLDEETELQVTVEVDETLTECSVLLNDEPCNGCSISGCNWDGFGMNLGVGMMPLQVKFDCRNLDNGIGDFGTCYDLDPFVYPLDRDAIIIPGVVEDIEEDSSDSADDESSLLEDLVDMVTGSSAHALTVTNGMALILLGGTLLAL